jgi:6,7-dimethyl-8-ribityllumazine synthase
VTGSEETRLEPGAFAALTDRVGRQVGDAPLEEARGSGLRIGLACALFNGGITARLLEGALGGLAEAAVDRADITVAWVPGAFELPLAAQRFATHSGVDAVVCLGAVIRGETSHYDFVAGQCAAGLARVALDTGVPVVFGVLTTENLSQALDRARPDETNKGREAGLSAVQMATTLRAIGRTRVAGGVGG